MQPSRSDGAVAVAAASIHSHTVSTISVPRMASSAAAHKHVTSLHVSGRCLKQLCWELW